MNDFKVGDVYTRSHMIGIITKVDCASPPIGLPSAHRYYTIRLLHSTDDYVYSVGDKFIFGHGSIFHKLCTLPSVREQELLRLIYD